MPTNPESLASELRAEIRYHTKRGGSAVERIPRSELARRMEALAKRGIDATARDESGRAVGWSWLNDGRRAWCVEEADNG